jgi:hypothetical protein
MEAIKEWSLPNQGCHVEPEKKSLRPIKSITFNDVIKNHAT